MDLSMSDSAKNQILKMQDEKGVLGIKISVGLSGCKGLSYVVNYATEKNEDDIEVNIDGAIIFVDKNTEFLMNGMNLDFVDSAMSSGFVFHNPNAKSQCGCGKSFASELKNTKEGSCCE